MAVMHSEGIQVIGVTNVLWSISIHVCNAHDNLSNSHRTRPSALVNNTE